MAGTGYSKADALKRLSEGRISNNEKLPETTPQNFVRMVVIDVISDPNSDLQNSEKVDQWIELNVSNISYAPVLPRNTIIARRVGETSNPMFVFPFFPSHLSLPCKPGECVWVMFERPSQSNSDMAFWLSRVIEPHVSDDVNHAHPGRSYETSLYPGTKEVADSNADGGDVWHELRNGPVNVTDDSRYTSRTGKILPGESDDVFESLINQSNASTLMSYEVVPRFRKRPGDVVLEGTNNSLIVLGTDRVGSVNKKESEFSSYAGSIDIVAGRGQTEDTLGKIAATTSIQDASAKDKGTELKKELNKSLEALSPAEGDPDFKNDKSRVLISQKTSPDTNFGLSSYNSKFGISDSKSGDAAIVIKSDKVRLIARSDIEIVVTGFQTSNSPSGESRKDEESSADKWASIVINSKGEIIIRPANESVIKLGGEDASKAVLCTESLSSVGGIVTATPISTTMGGQVGIQGSAGLGIWASKLLVK